MRGSSVCYTLPDNFDPRQGYRHHSYHWVGWGAVCFVICRIVSLPIVFRVGTNERGTPRIKNPPGSKVWSVCLREPEQGPACWGDDPNPRTATMTKTLDLIYLAHGRNACGGKQTMYLCPQAALVGYTAWRVGFITSVIPA